jgi:translation elongation factor EF-Ts
MEDLPESLITILKQNNEDFDEKGIKENIYVHGANNKQKGKPVSISESMTYDQLKRLIIESEQELCRKFNYHAF